MPVDCKRLSVTGAGQSEANGLYMRIEGPTPQWKKDTTHQLYRFGGVWCGALRHPLPLLKTMARNPLILMKPHSYETTRGDRREYRDYKLNQL